MSATDAYRLGVSASKIVVKLEGPRHVIYRKLRELEVSHAERTTHYVSGR